MAGAHPGAGDPLLFDLDGTLTDNYAGIAASIRHALAALGAPAPDDAALRACVGPPLRGSLARLLDTRDPATIERAIVLYRERFGTVGWSENVVYAGIAATLAALAADGAPMWLCTSKPQPYAERIVERFGLAPYLAGVYGATLDGAFDDKAVLLAHLLARERLAAATCTMIGDREHDIRAARANGTRAVGVLWGYGSRVELERAGAHALAASPDQLPLALARARATA